MNIFLRSLSTISLVLILLPQQGFAANRISYTLTYNMKARAIHVDMKYYPEGNAPVTFVFGNPGFGGQNDIFNCFRNLDVKNAECSVDSANRTVKVLAWCKRQSRANREKFLHDASGKAERTVNRGSVDLSYDVIDDGAKGQFQRELFRPVLKRDFFTCPTNCLFLLPKNLNMEVEVTWKKTPFPVYCYFEPKLKAGETYCCHAYDLVMSLIVGGKNLQHEYCKVGNADAYVITCLTKKEKFNYHLIKEHFTKYYDYLRTFWQDSTWEEYTLSVLPFLDDSITHDVGGISFHKGFGSKYRSSSAGFPFSEKNTHSGDTILTEQRMFNMSHEIGHHWFGGTLALGYQHQWFGEGFNDYLTYYCLYHSGIKDRTWFVDGFNKLFDIYYNSPVSNIPNDSIWTHYWQMGDYNKLPYRRGCIFAFYLDNLISKTSRGKYDFHDFVLLLKKRVKKNSNNMTIALFKSTLSEFLPKDNVEKYMSSYIDKGNLIMFDDEMMSLGFHIRYKDNVPQIY